MAQNKDIESARSEALRTHQQGKAKQMSGKRLVRLRRPRDDEPRPYGQVRRSRTGKRIRYRKRTGRKTSPFRKNGFNSAMERYGVLWSAMERYRNLAIYSAMPGVVICSGERMCSIFSFERSPFSRTT